MRKTVATAKKTLTSCFYILLCLPLATVADIVTLTASKDNTIYDDVSGTLSNGAGDYLFAGRNGIVGGAFITRGLLSFEGIATSIPAGSTINSVTLQLFLSVTNRITADQPVAVHRLERAWGEGSSNALSGEATGASAQPGDATWMHAMFSNELWTNAGGDYAATASAATTVAGISTTYQWSSAAMVDDVQNWLDDPQQNFGWLLRFIDEASAPASEIKRFHSRNNGANPPQLVIDFTPAGANDTIFEDSFE